MTLSEIKKAAESKKFRIEINKTKDGRAEIGVNYFRNMWAWWQTYGSDDYAFFMQTYSQNTGRVRKSVRTGMKIERLLKK